MGEFTLSFWNDAATVQARLWIGPSGTAVLEFNPVAQILEADLGLIFTLAPPLHAESLAVISVTPATKTVRYSSTVLCCHHEDPNIENPLWPKLFTLELSIHIVSCRNCFVKWWLEVVLLQENELTSNHSYTFLQCEKKGECSPLAWSLHSLLDMN